MSEIDNEIGDVQRTPKADPVTGGQMGRPHPALRRYAANYEAVSLSEALERLGARKNGEMEAIKGGLDDNSKDLDMTDEASLPTSTGDKSHLDPKGHNNSYDPFNGRMRDEVREIPENKETETMDDVRRRLMESKPGSVELDVSPKRTRKRRAEPSVDLELVERYARMKAEAEIALENLRREREALVRDSGPRAKEPVPEPPPAPAERKEDKSRIRVELSLDAMTFNVSAIDLVECRYGATLFIPTSGEAMTFVPTVGAEVVLTKQGGSPVRCRFTGVSFQVPGQEAMGLAFVRIARDKPSDGGEGIGTVIRKAAEALG